MTEGDFFRQPLRDQANLKHPLVRPADLINWDRLGVSMSESFVSRKAPTGGIAHGTTRCAASRS